MEKTRRKAAHNGGFSERVMILVTDNGVCIVSRRIHDYASKHFNHVHVQIRTSTPARLAGAVSWNLERRRGVPESARQYGKYALLTGRASGNATTEFACFDSSTRSTTGTLFAGRCLPRRSGRGNTKVAGMGRGRQKEFAVVPRELPNPDTIDNRDISPEILMETQVKWLNLYPAK